MAKMMGLTSQQLANRIRVLLLTLLVFAALC